MMGEKAVENSDETRLASWTTQRIDRHARTTAEIDTSLLVFTPTTDHLLIGLKARRDCLSETQRTAQSATLIAANPKREAALLVGNELEADIRVNVFGRQLLYHPPVKRICGLRKWTSGHFAGPNFLLLVVNAEKGVRSSLSGYCRDTEIL